MEIIQENSIKHHNGDTEKEKNGDMPNGYFEKRHKDKHKDKHKDRHKQKHHKRDKDRERDRDRDKKDRQHSSSRDKDREKAHKSSSNHSSDKNKSDRHDRDKDRSDKKSSSTDKDKSKLEYSPSKESRDSSSSSSKHKSKHKDKYHDRDRKERDKKERDSSKEVSPVKDSKLVPSSPSKISSPSKSMEYSHSPIKQEIFSPVKDDHTPIKMEKMDEDSDSDDDIPLSVKLKNRANASIKPKEESDDEDDVPLKIEDVSYSTYDSITDSLTNGKDHSSEGEDSLSESDEEEIAEDDSNFSSRKRSVNVKKESESDSEEDIPLSQRRRAKPDTKGKKRLRSSSEDDDDESYGRKRKKAKPSATKKKSPQSSPTKRRKKEEEEEEVWKWWEEAPREDGVKWTFLEHRGPVFAPPYEKLPKDVKLKYNGKAIKLSQDAEEVAGFYARFIEHEYTTKERFNTNFFKDWRKVMTKEERELITDLRKCDFKDINEYYKLKSEQRKGMSKEEKKALRDENDAVSKEYGVCTLDGHKEKIGNFRIEPPGLFRGRGDHPKMGMLKKRVLPEDVIINCSRSARVPEPPHGHRWKEIRCDNTVSWLANWTENVQGQGKYVMLNPTSRLKGEKDWMKYEKARELAKHIEGIRNLYKKEFKSKEMRVRQRAVATYFIDKLALRAGNEKDEDQADTVGCCSLRFEHVKLADEKDGKENIVIFDFLGKDSIRYYNEVPVESRVYKNLKIFMENKKPGDDLFDRLNTSILNKHLNELMDGLTAKVFRTYNASHTLQEQLNELTPKNGSVAEKVLAYNRANRAVAILCNHQRAVPKTHEKSMENLETKIKTKKKDLKALNAELKSLNKNSKEYEKKKAAVERTKDQLKRLEMNRTDREENKEIALGTSKLNYLDPRISVAWCKKYDVPIEKVYNKTQRAKFRWAIDMADSYFKFD